jgi:hypothetical protein
VLAWGEIGNVLFKKSKYRAQNDIKALILEEARQSFKTAMTIADGANHGFKWRLYRSSAVAQ